MLTDAKAKYDGTYFVDKKKPTAKTAISFTIPSAKSGTEQDVKLGPFDLSKDDTILTLQAKIQVITWFADFFLVYVGSNLMLQ